MIHPEDHQPKVCHLFHEAIEIIGRRWTGAILFVLKQGPTRFGDFRAAIPEMSDRLLTERLKELEQYGMIVREVSSERPVQVHYRLTPKGEALQPILGAIGNWAAEWNAAPEAQGEPSLS